VGGEEGGSRLITISAVRMYIKEVTASPGDAIYLYSRNTNWKCSVDTKKEKITNLLNCDPVEFLSIKTT